MTVKQKVKIFSKHAHKRYLYTLKQFCTLYGSRQIRTVGKDEFNDFEQKLKIKYLPMTVKDKLTILKTFYNYCYDNHFTRYNPRSLRIPKVMCRRVVLTWSEYEKMCSLLNPYYFKDLRMLLIMRFLAMGLRVGEVAKLNISNFNEISPELMHTIIESEKSKRERVISWNKDTHELLVKYLGVRICLNKEDWLFGTTDTDKRRKRITTRTIERWFEDLRNRAGIIRPVTPHSVRHMTAHMMRDAGADIKAIQIKLGHSSILSTDHYLNLDPQESLKALGKFKLV